MDMADALLNYAERNRHNCFVIQFGVDYLGKIGANYGRRAEEEILAELAERVANRIRPHDLFARNSARDFLLLAVDTNMEEGETSGGAALRENKRTKIDRSGKVLPAWIEGPAVAVECDLYASSAGQGG